MDEPRIDPNPDPAAPAGGPNPDEAPLVKTDATLVAVPGAEGAGSASLAEAAVALGAPVVPVPVGGPGVGAAQVAEPVVSVETRALDARTDDPRGPYAGAEVDRFPVVRAAATAAVFDPDEVEGTRRFETLTTIDHDGRRYTPGEIVTLDFRAYEQLVSIGAVPAIDWSTGRPLRL